MKKGWKTTTLKEITSILGDGLHGTPKYSDDGEFYFINGNNLTDGKIVYKERTKKVSASEYEKYKKNLNDRTVLVSINGTLGNVAFYQDEKVVLGKSACYFNLLDEIDKNFIRYIILSPKFVKYMHTEATGATIKNVSLKSMRGYTIDLPPLKEQKEIVAIIDEAFAAIDTARANLEKNIENAKELFESKLSAIFSQQGNNWEEKNLGEVCDNFQYGSSSKSLGEGKLPVLRMGNIQEGKIDWTNLKYSDNEVDNEKYLLNHDDIVFNRTNSPEHVGKTAIYKSEMPAIFAGYIIRVKVKEDVLNSDFLNFFLNSKDARDYGYSVMSSSVNQANINASKLKQYKIRLPDLETQVGLVKELQVLKKNIDRIQTSYIRKLESISELKKSILQKAFRGELTSKDIAA